ncbi:family 10 glycosylhydrolase [Fictibacillus nanhaiensis]|uniref:alpha amylase family protein n=1 Tax=Fictibacillus nanhaiensis TaxID=742169 RepID=UPI00203C37E9|nr:alpha amylase family protein [Fictibacillus nanhaiensis]MCM3733931.1 family 10 glycosylhydrolase [Fictibacillus nanhaiensis]
MKKVLSSIFTLILVFGLAIPAYGSGGNDQSRHQVLQNIVNEQDKKARILWYDLSANLFRLNTPKKVREIVKKTADAHFDTIVLDVKNSTGFVPYKSKLAPHISTSKIPSYQGYPADYDLLQTVIDEANKYGIKVQAAINVFSEGSIPDKDGPAYEHPEWQTTYYQAVQKVKAHNGETLELTSVNSTRHENHLVLYTPTQYDVSPANRWGAEIQVTDGIVTKIVDGVVNPESLIIPKNGYVVSGHGTSRQWLLENVKVGDPFSISEMETKFVRAEDYKAAESTFVNPIRSDVQAYELSIISELLDNYEIDGIVLDRARYSSIYADFSDFSREKFEEYIGQQVQNWPADIFKIDFKNNERVNVPGPLYQKWIEWRAGNIQSFFQKAEKLVHNKEPKAFFSTYVGSWYPLYYSEGVNWASKTHHPEYDWTSPDYHKKGYSETLDFIMTGNYFEDVTKEEAVASGNPDWYSVEGSADIVMDALNESTFNYGSLFVLQYADDPERFRRAIQMALNKTHGLMIFDLIYLEMYDWWHILEQELPSESKSPHHIPGLIKMVREDQ